MNAFQRKFVNEVRRCDEMERRLRYIEAEVRKDSVPIPDCLELPKAPNPREIIDLEVSPRYPSAVNHKLGLQKPDLSQNCSKICVLRPIWKKPKETSRN